MPLISEEEFAVQENRPGLRPVGHPEGLVVTRHEFSPPLPGEEDRQPPTWGETFGAAFDLENDVYNVARRMSEPDYGPADPEHNPLDVIKGTPAELYRDRFLTSRNRMETEAIKARIERELESRRILEDAGLAGFGAAMVAGVLSPTSLLPFGAVYRGYRFGSAAARTALRTGAWGAGAIGIQEAALHSAQETRTLMESLLAVGGGAVLAGLLGAGASAFSSRTLARASRQLDADLATVRALRQEAEAAAPQPRIDPDEPPFGRPATGADAGAAVARPIQENVLASAFGLEKAFRRFNPLSRMIGSENRAARDAVTRMAEMPMMLEQNKLGIPTGPEGGSVEARIKIDGDLALYRAQEALHRAFSEHRFQEPNAWFAKSRAWIEGNGPNKLSYADFKREVTKALRSETPDKGIEHSIPEVKDAAEAIRRDVFDAFKNEAVKLGLFPKDADFLAGYVMRRYDVPKILAEHTRFRNILVEWLQKGQAKAQRELAQLEARLRQAQGKAEAAAPEIDRLRQEIDALKQRWAIDPGQIDSYVDMWRFAVKDAPKKPQTLAQWVRAQGGIKDTGRTVEHMLGSKKEAGSLINNKRGVNLDDITHRAWEAGFFGARQDRPDINEFLDLLDEDVRSGRVVRQEDEEQLASWDFAEQFRDELDASGALKTTSEKKARQLITQWLREQTVLERNVRADIADDLNRLADLEEQLARATTDEERKLLQDEIDNLRSQIEDADEALKRFALRQTAPVPPVRAAEFTQALDRAVAVREALAEVVERFPGDMRVETFSAAGDLPARLRAEVLRANAVMFADATRALKAATTPEARARAIADLDAAKRGEAVEGFYDDGTIYVATYALDPEAVLFHEHVHWLKDTGRITDKEIATLARRAKKEGLLNGAVYRDVLAGRENLDELLSEEAAAVLVQARKDGRSFGARTDRIIDRILQLFERIANALRGRGFRTADDVVEAILSGEIARREVVRAVMRREDITAFAMRGRGPANIRSVNAAFDPSKSSSSNIMFAFAGERARTADLDALARAKEMEAQGKDRTAIWHDTGWFRGVDGKWRFEVDDSRIWLNVPEALDERGKAPLGDIENLREDIAAIVGRSVIGKRGFLAHPRLFEAYPDLAYITASIEELPGSVKGVYDRGRIRLREADLPTTMHETQHAIQKVERTARGGNPQMFTPEQIEAERARLSAQSDGGGWTMAGGMPADASDEMIARRLYARLAGEVEARTVERRLDYTPEQRKARPPWEDYDVPEDQQIVRMGEGAMFSLRSEEIAPGIRTRPWADTPPPVPGTVVRGETMFAIRAFHGSPHDFDRFSMEKIGTGEGNQAYGHGLYFAESEGVARYYQEALSPDEFYIAGQKIETPEQGFDVIEQRLRERGYGDFLDSSFAAPESEFATGVLRNIQDRIDAVKGNPPREHPENAFGQEFIERGYAAADEILSDLEIIDVPGRLYEVRINAEPDEFLDWDKPLSQQSEKVRKALGERVKTLGDEAPGEYAYWGAADPLKEFPSKDARAAASSQVLSEAGIKGIRYLDQGSRPSGEGTRNYVVFDDSLIEITAKDGKPVSKQEASDILSASRGEGRDGDDGPMFSLRQGGEAAPEPETPNVSPDIWNMARQIGARLNLDVPDAAGKSFDEQIEALEAFLRQAETASRREGRTAADDMQSVLDQMDELRYFADADAQELQMIAEDTIATITGAPAGRMINPFDPMFREGKSGPLKARTLKIPDLYVSDRGDAFADFLDDDIERIAASYVRAMAPDIAIAREFGDLDLSETLRQIQEDADRRTADAPDAARKTAIQEEARRAQNDLIAIAKRLRGTYNLPQDPSNWGPWTARRVKELNVLRLMGSVVAASIPDVMKLLMTHGFRGNADLFSTFITNIRGVRMSMNEAKEMSAGLDLVMSRAGQLWDSFADEFGGHSKFDRAMDVAVRKFGRLSLMDQWNSTLKQLSGAMTANRVLRASLDLANGRISQDDLTRLARSGISPDMAHEIAAQYQKHGGVYGRLWLANVGEWDQTDMAQRAARALKAAVRREADVAIVTPGQERPLWTSGTYGSVIGQFRTFQLITIQRTLIPALQESSAATYTAIAGMVALGILSEYLRARIHGKEERMPEDLGDWLYAGIANAGVLGWITDVDQTLHKATRGNVSAARLLFGSDRPISRFASQNVTGSMLGPTFGAGQDVVTAFGAATSGEPTQADIRAMRRLLPYQNLFWLSRALRAGEGQMMETMGIPQRRN